MWDPSRDPLRELRLITIEPEVKTFRVKLANITRLACHQGGHSTCCVTKAEGKICFKWKLRRRKGHVIGSPVRHSGRGGGLNSSKLVCWRNYPRLPPGAETVAFLRCRIPVRRSESCASAVGWLKSKGMLIICTDYKLSFPFFIFLHSLSRCYRKSV